jgi:hypothetical protein
VAYIFLVVDCELLDGSHQLIGTLGWLRLRDAIFSEGHPVMSWPRNCWTATVGVHSAIPGMLYVPSTLDHCHGLRTEATYLHLSRVAMDYFWLDAGSPCPNGELPQDFFGFSSLRLLPAGAS